MNAGMNPTPDPNITQAGQKTIRLLVAGAPKAGSTSLLRYLSQHPGITTHSQPEMSYFVIDHEFDTGYDAALTKYFPNAQPDSHLIAKHVHAMFSEDAEKRMLEHNPGMQLALLLRNPIQRAHSAYWYCRRARLGNPPDIRAGAGSRSQPTRSGLVREPG